MKLNRKINKIKNYKKENCTNKYYFKNVKIQIIKTINKCKINRKYQNKDWKKNKNGKKKIINSNYKILIFKANIY